MGVDAMALTSMRPEMISRAFRLALTEVRSFEVREPRPGVRHNSRPILVGHRFPVKGGLTSREAMLWQLYRPGPLFVALFTS